VLLSPWPASVQRPALIFSLLEFLNQQLNSYHYYKSMKSAKQSIENFFYSFDLGYEYHIFIHFIFSFCLNIFLDCTRINDPLGTFQNSSLSL